MTRVVAGRAGGRRLAVPPGGTRPTSDRVREALFSAVEALLGGLGGARVLDLYAGSGAVGLEALSRGAARALLVEADARAAETCRANARALGLDGAEVRRQPVERLAGEPPDTAYDLLVADPPYELPAGELRGVLADLLRGGWLAPAAVVVVERSTRDAAWTWPDGLVPDRSRRYGETTLWYGRAAMIGADR